MTERSLFTSQIGFLEGNFGKAFLEEYHGRVRSDYGNASALNVLRYKDGVVKGSNPFAVVLANQILREKGLRTATQADLEKALTIFSFILGNEIIIKEGLKAVSPANMEKALNLGVYIPDLQEKFKAEARANLEKALKSDVCVLDLRGTYVDTGLVLRSEEDESYPKNTPLAKDLGRQVKGRGINFSSKNPVLIPLICLELKKADGDYGLAFRLGEDADVYNAPILTEDGQFDSEDIDEKTGLPTKLRIGGRTLRVRNSGISSLGLLGDLDMSLCSNFCDLDSSPDSARIVVMKNGGQK